MKSNMSVKLGDLALPPSNFDGLPNGPCLSRDDVSKEAA